jgi:hypothetical protein
MRVWIALVLCVLSLAIERPAWATTAQRVLMPPGQFSVAAGRGGEARVRVFCIDPGRGAPHNNPFASPTAQSNYFAAPGALNEVFVTRRGKTLALRDAVARGWVAISSEQGSTAAFANKTNYVGSATTDVELRFLNRTKDPLSIDVRKPSFFLPKADDLSSDLVALQAAFLATQNQSGESVVVGDVREQNITASYGAFSQPDLKKLDHLVMPRYTHPEKKMQALYDKERARDAQRVRGDAADVARRAAVYLESVAQSPRTYGIGAGEMVLGVAAIRDARGLAPVYLLQQAKSAPRLFGGATAREQLIDAVEAIRGGAGGGKVHLLHLHEIGFAREELADQLTLRLSAMTHQNITVANAPPKGPPPPGSYEDILVGGGRDGGGGTGDGRGGRLFKTVIVGADKQRPRAVQTAERPSGKATVAFGGPWPVMEVMVERVDKVLKTDYIEKNLPAAKVIQALDTELKLALPKQSGADVDALIDKVPFKKQYVEIEIDGVKYALNDK